MCSILAQLGGGSQAQQGVKSSLRAFFAKQSPSPCAANLVGAPSSKGLNRRCERSLRSNLLHHAPPTLLARPPAGGLNRRCERSLRSNLLHHAPPTLLAHPRN